MHKLITNCSSHFKLFHFQDFTPLHFFHRPSLFHFLFARFHSNLKNQEITNETMAEFLCIFSSVYTLYSLPNHFTLICSCNESYLSLTASAAPGLLTNCGTKENYTKAHIKKRKKNSPTPTPISTPTSKHKTYIGIFKAVHTSEHRLHIQ